MSKLKRPSYLQLNLGSFGQSKSFAFEAPKSSNIATVANNVYSPTNSIDSECSPANTPTTPINRNYLTTPTDEYLPYSTKPIGSTVPFKTTDLIEDENPFSQRRTLHSTGRTRSDELATSFNSTLSETPDWFNESVNLNESFDFYKSTAEKTSTDLDESDDESNLDRTLTDCNLFSTINDGHQQAGNQLNNRQSNEMFNADKLDANGWQSNEYQTDNCPAKFKQLMDLAERSFIRNLQKSERKNCF